MLWSSFVTNNESKDKTYVSSVGYLGMMFFHKNYNVKFQKYQKSK